MRPAYRLVQRVHPAFDLEDFVAVGLINRHLDTRRARGILLEHPRIGLHARVSHGDALTANAVADSCRIDAASVEYLDVGGTGGALGSGVRGAGGDCDR